MDDQKRAIRPVNQKSVYHSAALIFEKLMNKEITVAEAEQHNKSLEVMNRTFALEIKFAEFEKKIKARLIELKPFDENSSQ